MSADTKTDPDPNMGARLARIESKLDRALALFESGLTQLQRIGTIDARVAVIESELELRAVLRDRATEPAPPSFDGE